MARWLIIVAFGLLVIVVFGFEAWPYLAIGGLIGISPLILRHSGVRISTKRVVIAVAVVLVVVLATLPFFAANEGELPFVSLVQIEATYDGEAQYRDDPERMMVMETITITNSALNETAADAAELGIYAQGDTLSTAALQSRLFKDVAARLTHDNWHLGQRGTTDSTFVRVRPVPVSVRPIPLETSNEIPLTSLRFEGGSDRATTIELQPSAASQMTLVAGEFVIGDTFPEGDRAQHVADGEEEVTVPLPDAGDPVEFEIRAPLARHELTAGLADLSLAGAGKWVLLFLMGILTATVSGVGQDALKKRLKRWWPGQRQQEGDVDEDPEN